MSSIMQQMARKEAMLGGLMSMSPEDRDERIRQIKAEAEKDSPFKRGQLVRLCHSPGISLVGGIHALPHDHTDLNQHSDSRVLGWDCFGGLMVAVSYGTNPHCGECTWTNEHVQPHESPDWKDGSVFKPGMELTFKWDLPGRWNNNQQVGDVFSAVLIEAHMKQGDWFVKYEKPDGSWITRVVNEHFFVPNAN